MKENLVPEELRKRGVSLAPLGLDETAFAPEDAIVLLREIQGREVAVLGGDVYRREGGRLEPTYDSWHCERDRGEAMSSFSERSQDYALRYMEDYSDYSAGTLFVLVLSGEATAGL